MKERKKYKIVEKPTKYAIIPEDKEYVSGMHCYTVCTKEKAKALCTQLNSEYYITDYSIEELQEFYKVIDWSGLIEELKTKLKTDDITIEEVKLNRDWEDFYQYEFTAILHRNLCKAYEILKLFFYSCTLIADSNNCFDVDKVTGELFFKINLLFEAEKYDLTTAYIPFLTATYSNTTKKWNFKYTKNIFKH